MSRIPRLLPLVFLFASCASATVTPEARELTIDYMAWSQEFLGAGTSRLLGHIREWDGPPSLHGFTTRADKVFYLESPDHRVTARTGTGGVTSAEHGRFVILHMRQGGLLEGHEYSLRPRNHGSNFRWRVAEAVKISLPIAAR